MAAISMKRPPGWSKLLPRKQTATYAAGPGGSPARTVWRLESERTSRSLHAALSFSAHPLAAGTSFVAATFTLIHGAWTRVVGR